MLSLFIEFRFYLWDSMGNLKETDPEVQQLVRSIVEKHLSPADRFIYGFADLSEAIDPRFGDFRFGISIGQKLDYGIVDSIEEGPTPEYYTHYKKTNRDLAVLSGHVAQELEGNGMIFLMHINAGHSARSSETGCRAEMPGYAGYAYPFAP